MSNAAPYRYDLPDAPPPRDTFDDLTASAGQSSGPDPIQWKWNLRGRPMTADEFADFKRNGGKTNYCEARLAWQQRLDERYETRRRRSEVFDLVVDVVAAWDFASYVAKQKKVVRDILALPQNSRRRKLSGLSPVAGRHQAAIRLVHALVFDGLQPGRVLPPPSHRQSKCVSDAGPFVQKGARIAGFD